MAKRILMVLSSSFMGVVEGLIWRGAVPKSKWNAIYSSKVSNNVKLRSREQFNKKANMVKLSLLLETAPTKLEIRGMRKTIITLCP